MGISSDEILDEASLFTFIFYESIIVFDRCQLLNDSLRTCHLNAQLKSVC